MPLNYQIFPGLGLVYVRYWGVANLTETMATFGQYAADPLASPDQKHLVDLSAVEDYDQDFAHLMQVQAQKADTVVPGQAPTLMVYHAPTPVSLRMARSILRSWEGLDHVIGMVAQTEEQAIDMLGLGLTRFADLPLKMA